MPNFRFILFFAIILSAFPFVEATAQQTANQPLTQAELVKLLYELPKSPGKKDALLETVRTRGIAFELTSGLRGLVSTKSGGDENLRRTLEEAARRRANPTAASLPSEKESNEVLEKARIATVAATDEMPDFVVKQLVARSFAYAGTGSWKPSDKLTIAVSYSADKGEDYRVLSVNGILQPAENNQFDYTKVGGTTSAGEFVTVLATIFKPDSKTEFQAIDTDVLRNRRCIVYSYNIKRENSKQTITAVGIVKSSTVAGSRGKIWIDRDNFRILRIESVATEMPSDFPVTAASRIVDYDWVTISDEKYLLPILSEVRLTSREQSERVDSRNLIAFRNYQKFGTEVKILEGEDEIIDETPAATAPTKP